MTQDDSKNMIPEIEIEAGKFAEKAYRDASVCEAVRIGIPHQIRAIRQQRGWSQKQLGERANKPQNVISRLEDPSYGKLSLKTLFELASAFDVALLVKFVPFSRFRRELGSLTPSRLEALGFEDDVAQTARDKSAFNAFVRETQKRLRELVSSLSIGPGRQATSTVSLPRRTFPNLAPKAPSLQSSKRDKDQLSLFPQPELVVRQTSEREWSLRARKVRMKRRNKIRYAGAKREVIYGSRAAGAGIPAR